MCWEREAVSEVNFSIPQRAGWSLPYTNISEDNKKGNAAECIENSLLAKKKNGQGHKKKRKL